MSFASFGGKTQSRTREIVQFNILLENENPVAVSAIVVDKITAPLNVAGLYDIQQMPYLKGLKFAHPASPSETSFEVEMLIGIDHYWKIVQSRVVRGDGPTAIESKLGYLISGPTSTQKDAEESFAMCVLQNDDDEALNRFWQTEALGTCEGG